MCPSVFVPFPFSNILWNIPINTNPKQLSFFTDCGIKMFLFVYKCFVNIIQIIKALIKNARFNVSFTCTLSVHYVRYLLAHMRNITRYIFNSRAFTKYNIFLVYFIFKIMLKWSSRISHHNSEDTSLDQSCMMLRTRYSIIVQYCYSPTRGARILI